MQGAGQHKAYLHPFVPEPAQQLLPAAGSSQVPAHPACSCTHLIFTLLGSRRLLPALASLRLIDAASLRRHELRGHSCRHARHCRSCGAASCPAGSRGCRRACCSLHCRPAQGGAVVLRVARAGVNIARCALRLGAHPLHTAARAGTAVQPGHARALEFGCNIASNSEQGMAAAAACGLCRTAALHASCSVLGASGHAGQNCC